MQYTLLLFRLSVIVTFVKGQTTPSSTGGTNTTVTTGALFFPYGSSNGDTLLPRADDSSYVVFTSTSGFPFLTNKENRLYASINGFIYAVDTNGPRVDIYRKDLDTRSTGYIYYRNSTSTSDIALTNQALRRYGVSSFNATMVFIITYYNVPQYANSFTDNTFQFIYGTDFRKSYGIFNYLKLESTSGVARFTEGSCNERELPYCGSYRSTRLTSTSNGPVRGRYVYKLSREKCRIYEDSGIIFSNISMYRSSSSALSSNYFTWQHRRPMRFAMLIEQRINYDSNVAVSFITGGLYPYFSRGISYYIRTVIIKRSGSYEYFQIMGIPSNFTEENVEFGSFSIPAFFDESYCMYKSFKSNFTHPPAIKVAYNNTIYPYNYFMLWVMNVTKGGFNICMKELYPFSGSKQITVKYIAVGNNTIEFPEAGKIRLTEISHMRQEKDRFCYTLRYKFSYAPKPYVFVTAEVGENKCPGVRSWVKEIYNKHAVVCASATSDTLQERKSNITLHYLINGRKSSCSYINCPVGQECVLNSDLEPTCNCTSYCIDTYDPVCGHDSITYNNTCQFLRAVCLQDGTSANRNYSHPGECKTFPFQAGSVQLEPIPNVPVAFCKYVYLNNKRFASELPMHIQLTITWRNQTFKEGSAVWSENVTTSGFSACVLVAGRHFFGGVPTPNVFWMAYQKGLMDSSEGKLTGGSISISLWSSGSKCQRLPGQRSSSLSRSMYDGLITFVSVEQTQRRRYANALTTWVEAYYNGWFICVRELQNFDGVHDEIKVHWLIMRQANNTWNREIISEVKQHEIGTITSTTPVCSENQINKGYPSLPHPTVISSPLLVRYRYKSSTNVSENDVAAWIKRTDQRSVAGCVQSAYPFSRVTLSYMVIPTLCEDGWTFHDSRCYFVGRTANRNQAEQICQNKNATLVTIRSQAQLYFMKTLDITRNTWIGLTDGAREGNWQWTNGDVTTVTDWGFNQPDGGVLENCCVMNISDTYKWHDQPCSSINDYVCERDANLLERTCAGQCLNGGSCVLTSNGTECLCPLGLFGERCENDVKDVPECNNYTTLYDTWRRVNHNISRPSNSCDTNLVGNNTWYRFDESKILEHSCPNTTSHYCGVQHPGYFVETHPSVGDGVKQMRIHYYRFYCSGDYGTAFVRNCASFFVYKFPYLPFWDCDYGICTEFVTQNSRIQ